MIDFMPQPVSNQVLESIYGPPSNPASPGARSDASPPPEGDSLDLSSLAQSLAKDHKAMALFEFQYQAQDIVSQFTGQDGQPQRQELFSQSFDLRLTIAGDPEAAKALLERLQAEFTPEKVAGRIADFAQKGFKGADKPEERSAFRDFIQAAVDLGYGQALDMLGHLADPVKDSLEKTMQLVKEKMDAFAKGEVKP